LKLILHHNNPKSFIFVFKIVGHRALPVHTECHHSKIEESMTVSGYQRKLIRPRP
jgi:hypothetical protein